MILLLLLATVLVVSGSSEQMRVLSGSTTSSNVVFIDSFDMTGGGSISIDVVTSFNTSVIPSPDTYVYVCFDEASQLKVFDSGFCTDGPYANSSSSINCDVYSSSNIASAITTNVPPTDIINGSNNIYVNLINCEVLGGEKAILKSCLNNSESSCKSCPRATFFNNTSSININQNNCPVAPKLSYYELSYKFEYTFCTNESCLRSSNKYMPLVMKILVIVWALCLVLWGLNIASEKEMEVTLQCRMALIPISKLLTVISLYFKWNAMNGGESFQTLELISYVVIGCYATEKVFSASVLMFIANGWKITTHNLRRNETQKVWALSVLWGILWVFLYPSLEKTDINNSTSTSKNNSNLVLAWLIVWVSIFLEIWNQSMVNKKALLIQMELVRRTHINPKTTPVYTKLCLFQKFRGIYAYYLLCSFAIGLVPSVHGISIQFLLLEVAELLLYGGLGYVFRCQKFNHLFLLVEDFGRHSASAVEPAPVSSPPGGMLLASLTWEEGMPLPSMPSTHSIKNPKKTGVVVIQQPGKAIAALGESIDKTEDI